jgi:hypothetical protein
MRTLAHILALLILAATQFVARGAATQFYGLVLGQRYNQTSAGNPALLTTKGFEARVFVYSTATTVASIKKPTNTSVALTNAGDHIEISNVYDVSALMKSAWPSGSYAIGITNAADGGKTSTMYLGGDLYPAPPRVANFAEAQSISPGQNFVLRWDPLFGPNAADLVQVRLEEAGVVLFETSPIPGAAGALNGASTSVALPANRLGEGRLFSCTITAWRAITKDTTTISGARGEASYYSRTTIPLRTRYLIQDVLSYGVEKRVIYEQTGGVPTLRANPFEMTAFVTASTTQSVTSAVIRAPSGATTTLTPNGFDHGFVQAFASPAAMDGAFASGGYEMRMMTKNNGFRTNTLSLVGNYPQAAPQVANIDEAQYIKTGGSFTLSWTLAEAQPTDHLQVVISDGATVVFSTPAIPGVVGALTGSARSVAIPAGTFSAGKTYTGLIRHCRPTAGDSATYPLAYGMAGHSRVTRFSMQTASGPSPQPTLAPLARINDQTEISFTSVRGEKYVIHSSTGLPAWTQSAPITATGTSTVYRLPPNPATAGFYRVVTVP